LGGGQVLPALKRRKRDAAFKENQELREQKGKEEYAEGYDLPCARKKEREPEYCEGRAKKARPKKNAEPAH